MTLHTFISLLVFGAAVASTQLPGSLNTYLGLKNGMGYVGFVGDNGFFPPTPISSAGH